MEQICEHLLWVWISTGQMTMQSGSEFDAVVAGMCHVIEDSSADAEVKARVVEVRLP